jgi:thiol-disulfide isomerase/thioredoxin
MPAQARERGQVNTADGVDISYERFPAAGKQLVIWLPSEAGYQDSEARSAQQLADAGTEVWVPEMLEARFLPQAQSSLDRLPAGDVMALLDAACASGKTVYVYTSGRSVIPALRGARQWLLQDPQRPLFGGIIMNGPKFFLETPEPGLYGELMPVVSQVNLPVYIIQAGLSPWYWKLDTTVPALARGGSDVYVQILGNIRGRFNFRPDANAREQAYGQRLPQMIQQAMRMLSYVQRAGHQQPAVSVQEPAVSSSKKDRTLRPYAGDPQPPELVLPDMQGRQHDLQQYRGQVVLVNFWASWCPPCVYEMPSMQRLQDRLEGKPFTILAVNMAETRPTIEQFLRDTVQVDFPILLDSDGAALKRWQVFAFPTTFLIDKQGRIRYAMFGGREWDTTDVLEILKQLLAE